MRNAVALGTFDGIHKGHRAVLAATAEYNAVAVTFKVPPKAVLTGFNESIMTAHDKCIALKQCGINEIELLDFASVRDMNPEDFFEVICNKYNPALISCGFNYRFGRNGAGDTLLLSKLCEKKGIVFKCCEKVSDGGKTISSTAIRELLKNGDVRSANRFLYRSFSFTAEVIHGDERGRTFGFPTINQRYPKELVQLKFGVYVSRVEVDGREYNAISNIGIRPTYKTDCVMSETYIKNFSGDLYGKNVTVKPCRFLRGEIKFSSAKELKSQIEDDLKQLAEKTD